MDTKDIGVKRLRGSMSFIPRDPFIFQGSVRSNVDPFDEFTDDEVWDTLGKVGGEKFTLFFIICTPSARLPV